MDWSLKSQVGSPQEWRTVQQGDPANNETVPHGKKAHLQEITPKDNEGKHCRVISGQITIIPKVPLISYQTWKICIGNFGTLPHNNLHCSLRLGGGLRCTSQNFKYGMVKVLLPRCLCFFSSGRTITQYMTTSGWSWSYVAGQCYHRRFRSCLSDAVKQIERLVFAPLLVESFVWQQTGKSLGVPDFLDRTIPL